jgi:ABC-type amino acid transport substrate-binding protein
MALDDIHFFKEGAQMRFTTGLLLAALLAPQAHAELIDDVSDRNELRIAVQADTAPYAFQDEDTLVGFEIELGAMIADELDVHASFIKADDSDLLSGVESGKYDIALDHIAPTPALRERLDFSTAYGPSSLPPVAIPFQKGNAAFQAGLDNALTRIRNDGRLASLTAKWFPTQVTQASALTLPAPPVPAPPQATQAH